MGTRGSIAVRQPDGGWRGVYNHFDSYPTGLGVDLYAEVKKHGLKKLSEELLKYGDWREYLSGGICEYCGKKVGQPHSIEGTIFGFTGADYMGDRQKRLDAKTIEDLEKVLETEFNGAFAGMASFNAQRQWPIIQNMRKTGYPDPDAKHHKHGEGPKDHMTDKRVDALYIEWLYVLDPVENVIEVWKSRSVNGKVRKSGVSEYEHVKATTISMGGPTPDWQEVEKLGRKVADYEDED